MEAIDHIQRELNGLWGGVLHGVELDVARQMLRLHVSVNSGGISTNYEVTAEGLSDLRFQNSIPAPWTYAEVSEAWLSERDGQVELALEIWSEDATLTLKAESVRVETAPRA